MVSPVRIRVPPLLKVLQIEEEVRAPVLSLEPFYCNRAVAEGFVYRSCGRLTHAGRGLFCPIVLGTGAKLPGIAGGRRALRLHRPLAPRGRGEAWAFPFTRQSVRAGEWYLCEGVLMRCRRVPVPLEGCGCCAGRSLALRPRFGPRAGRDVPDLGHREPQLAQVVCSQAALHRERQPRVEHDFSPRVRLYVNFPIW